MLAWLREMDVAAFSALFNAMNDFARMDID
jgi:hypothetical protein